MSGQPAAFPKLRRRAISGPQRPRPGIRWAEVMAGFVAGLVLVWGSRILLFTTVSPSIDELVGNSPDGGAIEFALLFPTVLLVAGIWWAAKKRWKGIAVGMALYGAIAALFLGGLALRNGLAW